MISKGTNYWLFTDAHLGHKLLVEEKIRPLGFEEKIFEGFCTIPEGDVLIFLGDYCIGDDEYWHNSHLEKFNFRKWMVLGNHDSKSVSWYLRNGWDYCANGFFMQYAGLNIFFSHRPHEDIGYDLNVHGHLHTKEHRNYDPKIKNAKQRLLSIENTDYKPVKLTKFVGQ